MKLLGFTQAPARLSRETEGSELESQGTLSVCFLLSLTSASAILRSGWGHSGQPALSPCAVPMPGVTWLLYHWATQSHPFVTPLVRDGVLRGLAQAPRSQAGVGAVLGVALGSDDTREDLRHAAQEHNVQVRQTEGAEVLV